MSPARKISNTGSSPNTPPAHEEIARLAYLYWEARGRPIGSPEEDWLRAEQDLLMERLVWGTAKMKSHVDKHAEKD